jgi:beta-galactosidase GanA
MNWQVYNFPMDNKFIYDLRSTSRTVNKPGLFFKGNFYANSTGDTFFDMSNYKKGIVWINGHNLGRFWEIGPQKRLYCPASWLKLGLNEIIVFDLHQTSRATISGMTSME